ncbi:glutathione S-transferase family protein [Amaricoccus tamworthensis]|uniref:glutathione S-transferase family protein n=1 Tax=Amaricoccus tamworthensis TaxID=57002 RepID=UPI003C7D5E91
MITLHALQYSRATRVLWLLADLGQSCNRVDYERTDEFRAPDTLSRVHPLGKSPVIEDDGLTLAESATILRYLAARFGDNSHTPPVDTAEYWRHEALFDGVESTLAPAAMGPILASFRGESVPDAARAALNRQLDFISVAVGDGPLLYGETAMLADIQISYIIALLARFDLLAEHPKVAAYWDALQQQPGYIAAVRSAGPMAPPA